MDNHTIDAGQELCAEAQAPYQEMDNKMNAKAGLETMEPNEAACKTAHQSESPTVDEAAEARKGAADGRHWAQCQATAHQLSVLAAMAESYEPANDVTGNPVSFLNCWLAMSVGGIYGQDIVDCDHYRDMLCSPARKYSNSYLRAFVRAAAEVWRECQAEIEVGCNPE